MEEKQLYQVPAIVTKVTTMSDGGLRLQVDTNELAEEEKTLVFSLHQKFGYFIFKNADIEQEDILNVPEFVKEFKEDKSPSQRLRAVLFIMYEKHKKDKNFANRYSSFDEFYKRKVDEIIKHFKSKISET